MFWANSFSNRCIQTYMKTVTEESLEENQKFRISKSDTDNRNMMGIVNESVATCKRSIRYLDVSILSNLSHPWLSA